MTQETTSSNAATMLMLNEYWMLIDTSNTGYEASGYSVIQAFSGPTAEAQAVVAAHARLKLNPLASYVIVKAMSRFSLPRSPVLVERFK